MGLKLPALYRIFLFELYLFMNAMDLLPILMLGLQKPFRLIYLRYTQFGKIL